MTLELNLLFRLPLSKMPGIHLPGSVWTNAFFKILPKIPLSVSLVVLKKVLISVYHSFYPFTYFISLVYLVYN